MSDVTTEDVADLKRITDHMQKLFFDIRTEPKDLVCYGIALAVAARAAHQSIVKFGGPDVARYEHLGKIMQELDK